MKDHFPIVLVLRGRGRGDVPRADFLCKETSRMSFSYLEMKANRGKSTTSLKIDENDAGIDAERLRDCNIYKIA